MIFLITFQSEMLDPFHHLVPGTPGMVLQLPLAEAMCRIEEEHQELFQLDVHQQLSSIQETTHFTQMLLTF